MEFQEFWKQRKRMCKHKGGVCVDYEMRKDYKAITSLVFILEYPDRAEAIVEKWAKEHPVMTNAMKFKEVFGYEHININGNHECPPRDENECNFKYCKDCQKWWDKEYKEPNQISDQD